jgi:hypothetical protein
MRSTVLFLVAIAMLVIPQAASAQYYDQYGRRYYDDGYRQPPPPPPPGYYEERRYYREQRPPEYREREVYRQPRGGVMCAREGGFCAFEGPAIVRYGAGGRFVSRRAFNGIACNNSVFGDPFVGADKACFID